MKFLIDRELHLNTNIEHKSLYSWAIVEIDQNGNKIGRDLIPWEWTVCFTAVSCNVCRSTKLEPPGYDINALGDLKISHDQIIKIELNPGLLGDGEPHWAKIKLSMFGSNRTISDFRLNVYKIDNLSDKERCTVWGTVAYEYEHDFRDEIADDCIIFSLFLKPEIFDRYIQDISIGAVEEIVLQVKNVDGFYSDWSPSISTDNIKVLTTGEEHKINVPPGLAIKVPRLGEVGAVTLSLNRRKEFDRKSSKLKNVDKAVDLERGLVSADIAASTAASDSVLRTLTSLRRAAWISVLILTIICLNALIT